MPPLCGIEAVLFDMDGTLVLTEDRTDRALEAFLVALDVGFDAAEVDLTRFHGVTWADTARWLVARYPALTNVDIEGELQRRFHASFLDTPPPPVPGARQAVAAASAAVPTAIVTSSNRETLTVVCDQLDLHGLLMATITAEDCTESKPSPQPFVRAAEQLGVDPAGCLVFEDSRAGVASAIAAGCSVIAIGAESGHLHWVADYHDLPEGFFAQAARAAHG